MKKIGLTLMALLTFGCSPSDKDAINSATSAVIKELRDPESAKFSDVYVARPAKQESKGDQAFATCGLVNAKNGMGGYAGPARFVVLQAIKDGKVVSDKADVAPAIEEPIIASKHNPAVKLTPFEHVYWNTACVDAGHPAL